MNSEPKTNFFRGIIAILLVCILIPLSFVTGKIMDLCGWLLDRFMDILAILEDWVLEEAE